MRWLTASEVAEHMLGIAPRTFHDLVAAGELDGVVTKRRGTQTRWHPEAAWYFACHGRPADSLEEAYAWAEVRPLPAVPTRGAQLVEQAS